MVDVLRQLLVTLFVLLFSFRLGLPLCICCDSKDCNAADVESKTVLSCRTCGSVQHRDHALIFLASVKKKVSHCDFMSDSWCREVSSIPDQVEAAGGGTVSISHCISCHFKSSVLATKHSFTLPSPAGA